MSEIKSTLGPWEVDATGYRAPSNGLCVMAGDLCVSVVLCDSDKPQAANARLIAAAPDLLTVSEHAIQWLQGDKWRFDEDPTKRESWEIMMRALKNAVAKARGES